MRKLVIPVAVLSSLYLLSMPAPAHTAGREFRQDQVKVGGLRFTPPRDWTPTRATSRVVLAFAPPDLPKGKICQVRVYADEVPRETFSAWFSRRWSALMSGKPSLRTSDVLTQKVGPVELMVRSGAYAESGSESYSLIIAASVQGHFVLAAYDANDFALIEKHQEEVYAIFATMDIEGVGKAPGDAVPPKPAPGEPAAPKPAVAEPAAIRPAVSGPAGSAPKKAPAATAKYTTGDAKVETDRINRLSEIAHLLQDPKSDAVALLTEAARLCGFAIWTEDRQVLAEPVGEPRLKLALTDVEIREYSEMFRSRNSVALNDLVAMLDVAYVGAGTEPSCGPLILEWLENGGRSGNRSVRALTSFIQYLGAFRGGGSASVFQTGRETLDPIQALLILRVASEEIGVGLRNASAKKKPTLLLASYGSSRQAEEASGSSESGFGGVAGLLNTLGQTRVNVEPEKDNTAMASALLSITKFIATYALLKSEIRVEAPGQPLVRTTSADHAGQTRKVIAKFWIDGVKASAWMKAHPKLVAASGLTTGIPEARVLKGVPTDWAVDQDHLSSNILIRQVMGGPALHNLVTNDAGEAAVEWEGAPQPVTLDPKKVMPINKQVWITVTPQVKDIKVQSDLWDALMAASGILKKGAGGLLKPLMDMLYRLKWNGEAYLLLNVRDWQEADTIGQLNVETKASWSEYTNYSALHMTLNRKLTYSDVGMSMVGGAAEAIDPKVFEHASPLVRQQMEAGLKLRNEMAKNRMFFGKATGNTLMTINDLMWQRGADGCDTAETTDTTTWIGKLAREFKPSPPDQFMVTVDLEKKLVKVRAETPLRVKYVSVSEQGSSRVERKRPPVRTERDEDMHIFSGVTMQAPYSNTGEIEIPLKETKVIDSDETNYYGAVSIPYTFGPGNKFHDNFIFSYSVTRKVTKKK